MQQHMKSVATELFEQISNYVIFESTCIKNYIIN